MEFFDVHEHTKYKITICRPESIDQLSDMFTTEDELKDLIGDRYFRTSSTKPRTYLLNDVITKELEKWADKLDASGKKTLEIDDEELLDILKSSSYVSDFIDESYGRHGNRICYSRRYKRTKKKPTRSDVREFWIRIFPYAFRSKFDCFSPYFTTYDRHLAMFKAWKKVLGWKACSKFMSDPTQRKFYRMIWDNPEEYV